MKTVAMIPIKLGSKRIPKKNIKPFFDGTPLMSFIQKICLEAKRIDEVYIYSSDEEVMNYTLPGVKFLLRPKWLDADSVNANDIINEFMKTVDADIYVNTHTTSPFAKPETLDICVEKVMDGGYDSAFCAEVIRNFMWLDGKPLNFDPSNFPRTQDLPKIFSETSIAYVFTKESFKTHNRRLGIKPWVQEVDKIEAIDIDYPEDFDIANAIYKEIIMNKQQEG